MMILLRSVKLKTVTKSSKIESVTYKESTLDYRLKFVIGILLQMTEK